MGCQVYIPDENVSLQQALFKKVSEENLQLMNSRYKANIMSLNNIRFIDVKYFNKFWHFFKKKHCLLMFSTVFKMLSGTKICKAILDQYPERHQSQSNPSKSRSNPYKAKLSHFRKVTQAVTRNVIISHITFSQKKGSQIVLWSLQASDRGCH